MVIGLTAILTVKECIVTNYTVLQFLFSLRCCCPVKQTVCVPFSQGVKITFIYTLYLRRSWPLEMWVFRRLRWGGWRKEEEKEELIPEIETSPQWASRWRIWYIYKQLKSDYSSKIYIGPPHSNAIVLLLHFSLHHCGPLDWDWNAFKD